jgi:hypothetical protein
VTSRRRPALAKKRRDRDVKRLGIRSSDVDRHMRNPGLDSVDLEVGDAELVGELLTAQFLDAANLSDSSGNKRKLALHPSVLSESDRAVNLISAHDGEGRDTVDAMPGWAHDLSYEECDLWRAAQRVEWDVLLRKAGVKSHKDVIKSRWLDGGAPRDRAKIRAVLEDYEKKVPTEIGATIIGLEEWFRLGEALAQDPKVFLEQLERLRDLAKAVTVAATARRKLREAETVMEVLRSPTPSPRKLRK